MLLVWLVCLLHFVFGLVIAKGLFKVERLADLFFSAGLCWFITFCGFPIAIGFVTGVLSTVTILLSLVFAALPAAWLLNNSPELRSWLWGQRNFLRGWTIPEFLLFALLTGTILILYCVGLYYSSGIWDAASYHLVGPMQWSLTNQFEQSTPAFGNFSAVRLLAETAPNSKGIIPFLILEWTNQEQGTALVQWPFLLIALAAFYSIARRAELSRYLSLLVTAFLLFVPEILLQSLESYADVQYLAAQLCLIALLLQIWQQGHSQQRLWLLAFAFALLTSSKPNGLPQGGVYGILLLALLYFRSLSVPLVARLSILRDAIICVCFVSFVVAGPWYLRNLIVYENPLYPVRVEVAGRILFQGPMAMDVSRQATAQFQGVTGVAGWWKGISEAERLPMVGGWSTGLGTHTFLLGLPAVLFLTLFLLAHPRRGLLLPVVLLFAFFWLVNPVKNLPRFGMIQIAAAGLAFALILQDANRYISILLQLILGTLLIFNVYRTIPAVAYRMRPAEVALFPVVTGVWRGDMVDVAPEAFTGLDWWREVEAKSETRLAVVNPELELWWARPLNQDARIAHARLPYPGEQLLDWHARLLNQGFTHVLIRKDSPVEHQLQPPLFVPLFSSRNVAMETPFHLPIPTAHTLYRIHDGRSNP
ncbi:MAG: hypothetical protein SFY68_05130 [Candidatus Sumerlaeia bacterium]|nr:hypothetical protein [Candidatus Sumerlaeia bacterium]